MKWHHIGGLVIGGFVFSWILSGWLSMDHGRLFSTGEMSEVQSAAYTGISPSDAAKLVSSDLLRGMTTYHDRRQKFDYDLAFFTTYAAPYDPHGTLSAMFLSTSDSGPDGKIFVSKELDGLIQAALSATGEEHRVKIQKVYDWMNQNAAICPLV